MGNRVWLHLQRLKLRSLVWLAVGAGLTLGLMGPMGHRTAWAAEPDRERLSPAAIATYLPTLPGWQTDGQQLTCTYRFANFVEAVNFVSALVEPAEAAAHHPDIAIAYSRVSLSLTTHDAGGITTLDISLARTISHLRASRLSDPSQSASCEPYTTAESTAAE